MAFAIYKNQFQFTGQSDCCIGNYVLPKRGKNLLSRDAILGNVPVVAGGIEASTYHNVSNTKAPVITISASGANAGYVNLWDVPVWSSDSSYIDSDITDSVYFWYVTLKTRQKEIFEAQTGSAQAHIYPQHIAELQINKLNMDDIANYEKEVKPFFKMIGQNKKENKYLDQLRDTLLPKLMNGEIDLYKIEI
ncbi:MAG: restriction endonuclease subunit S [Clostridia bacterium]|nr:restriction endonuclease subunit S [Clostridia bacterium]